MDLDAILSCQFSRQFIQYILATRDQNKIQDSFGDGFGIRLTYA